MGRISFLLVAAVSCLLLASVTCKPAGNAVNNGVDLEIREAELTLLRSLLEAEKRLPGDEQPPPEVTPDFDEPQTDTGPFDDVDTAGESRPGGASDQDDEDNADGDGANETEADGNSVNETNGSEPAGTAGEGEDDGTEAAGTAGGVEDDGTEAAGTAGEVEDDGNEPAGTAGEGEDDGTEAAGTAGEVEDDGNEPAGTDANADEITDAEASEEEDSNESEEEPEIAVSVPSKGHSGGHPSSESEQNETSETQPDDSVEDDVYNDHKRIMAYLYSLIDEIKKEITKGDLQGAINKIDIAKMEVDGYLLTLQNSQKQAEKYQAKVEKISNLLEAGMDQLLNEIVKENSFNQESPLVNDDDEQAPPASLNEEDNEPATPNVEDSQPTPPEENEEENDEGEDVAQAEEFRRALELLKTLKKIRSELNIQKDN